MSLELIELRKTFDSVAAVDGVTLTVRDGEFFSLLGPSGCGKTTLLRTVAGIYQPDAGDVILKGRDITKLPMNLRNTALVFQNYALFPHLNVFDNIAFGLTLRREKKNVIRDKVKGVLELVHMEEFGSRYPGQLSGGQQQRVALARALVIEPDLLLLDEPLSNLDAKLREAMRHEIRKIQERVGITTILVTHDIHEAFAMSDRIAVMNMGRIEQVGTPKEIYSHPSTRFTAEFSGQANYFVATITALEQGVAVAETDAGLMLCVSVSNAATRVGDTVSLMLRPECVRVVEPGQGGLANRFEGVIEEVTYLGGTTVYHMRVGASVLIARVNNTSDPGFDAGQSVTIEWSEGDAVAQDG